MTGVLRWEEPPSVSPTDEPFDSRAVAEELRERPYQWALVSTSSTQTSLASRIRHGRVQWFRPAGAFQAAWRSIGGVPHIYARYVGGDQ